MRQGTSEMQAKREWDEKVAATLRNEKYIIGTLREELRKAEWDMRVAYKHNDDNGACQAAVVRQEVYRQLRAAVAAQRS